MRKLENVSMEITSKCNFYCKHCGNNSGKTLYNSITKEEIINVIDQMYEMKVEKLRITGGEPFVSKNIFNYISYASDKIPLISISSNGYLITEEIVSKLKYYNVEKIVISLDGTSGFHDEFRGVLGAYKKAIEVINLLVKNGIEVKVRSVITNKNKDSILELIGVTNELGIKTHEIIPVCPIGRANNNTLIKNVEYLNFIKDALKRISCLSKTNIIYQLKPVFGQESLFKNVPLESREKSLSYKCDAFDNSIQIANNGDVLGCSFVQISAGNIKKNKLYDIWHSSSAKSLHEIIINNNKEGECKNCLDNNKCNGGCYANKLYGDVDMKKDIYCFVKRRY